MSEEAKESHWRELAARLGAEPSEIITPPETPDSETQPADVGPPDVDAVEASLPMPEPKQSDWGGLANSLGIEVPETESSQPVADSDLVSVPEPSPEPEVSEETLETTEETFADFGEGLSDEEGPSEDSQQAETAGLAFWETEEAEEAEESEAAEAPEEEPEEGAEREEDEEAAPKRRRRRRRRRGRERSTETTESGEREAFTVEMESIEAEVEFANEAYAAEDEIDQQSETSLEPDQADAELLPEETESNEELPTERRRRRRRRGRRGGRREDREEREPSQAEDTEDMSDELSDERGPLLEDDEETGSSTGRSRRKTAHRNIPTWQEAVDMVIAPNMDVRSRDTKSPGNARRGRGGRSGGRGRKGGSRR